MGIDEKLGVVVYDENSVYVDSCDECPNSEYAENYELKCASLKTRRRVENSTIEKPYTIPSWCPYRKRGK